MAPVMAGGTARNLRTFIRFGARVSDQPLEEFSAGYAAGPDGAQLPYLIRAALLCCKVFRQPQAVWFGPPPLFLSLERRGDDTVCKQLSGAEGPSACRLP